MDFYTGHCFFKKVLLFVMCFVCSYIETDAQDYYRLITSTSELEANAKYLIASMAKGDGYVMKNYASGDNNCKGIATTSDGGIIAFATGMAKLTAQKYSTNSQQDWLFKNESDMYMSATTKTGTYLKFTSKTQDNGAIFTVSFSSELNAVLACKNKSPYKLYFNSLYGNTIFSCYSDPYSPVYLYKEVKSMALSISGSIAKTSYKVGEVPTADELNVVATFDGKTQKDVTKSVAWSYSPETITENTTKITVTATYAGKSVSKSFAVKVDNPSDYTRDLTVDCTTQKAEDLVEWNTDNAKMTLHKNESSEPANANIGENGVSRAFDGQLLTITPVQNMAKVVFTMADNEAASTFDNHTFDNVSESFISENEVELIPAEPSQPISIDIAEPCSFTRLTVHTTISVAMSDARYATLCLPYAANIPEGLEVYAAKDNGDKIRLMKKEDIAANEGVVLYGEAGVTYSFAAKGGTVEKTAGNEMVGVNVATILTKDDDVYLLGKNNTTGKVAFRLLSTDRTMVSHRAYLKPDKASASRMLIDISDDTETGIETVPGRENGAEATRIYNLAGQRMSRATKGINIVNGKLTIK